MPRRKKEIFKRDIGVDPSLSVRINYKDLSMLLCSAVKKMLHVILCMMLLMSCKKKLVAKKKRFRAFYKAFE